MVFVEDLDGNIRLRRSSGEPGLLGPATLLHKISTSIPNPKLITSLVAFRRVETITNHLLPYKPSPLEAQSQLALVPLPGTFEFDQWLNVLEQSRPDSVGLKTLSEWKKGFSASSTGLSRALHRIRIMAAHLTTLRNDSPPIVFVE
mmetsp:Transcript_7158/g.8222  ORF Transcript_7158/g.8222 Transcript_7158/m.8222 type:complete len:146 (-) Transcript_7158:318-755(-)|eukprot:CAMPEP_0184016292 /NCGR_PEP_ID=MMETSP0954-20121128/6843_1 /TAXON_ID=627963 /ORGANISM="Aplanochytrium sp, Strain PBS07" /LENGTH=145 /DNA_ID=CAMNT_0026297287 /DNA_START=202 /DNA_END=639 /DNA_ORIENTATION=-